LFLILLLVDERPEEVTDLERESRLPDLSFQLWTKSVQRHVQVAEMVMEARETSPGNETGRGASTRQYHTAFTRVQQSAAGQGDELLSGGVEAKALVKPKKFFGSARNVEEGGSLTVLATALTETGSRMDELIFEEFKGTGNMELHLDRALQEKNGYIRLSTRCSQRPGVRSCCIIPMNGNEC